MVKVRDPVYRRTLDFSDPLFEDLIKTPEFQRTKYVMQLALTHEVFPGATHTRFSHMLGASYLAGEVADQLHLPADEKRTLQSALLLHDIGHWDLSHALEGIMPQDHEANAHNIIVDGHWLEAPGAGQIPAILDRHEVDKHLVVQLITGTYDGPRPYLRELVTSDVVDIDKMDYLLRDVHFTGADIGAYDLTALASYLQVHEGRLSIPFEGIPNLEQLLAARIGMHKRVYHHPTTDIAESMIRKAVELAAIKECKFGDMMLFQKLLDSKNATARELTRRVMLGKRAFYQPAFQVKRGTDRIRESVRQWYMLEQGSSVWSVEDHIRDACKLGKGEVILTFRNARRNLFKEDELPYFPVTAGSKTHNLFEISRPAQALRDEYYTDDLLCVYCDEADTEKVAAACRTQFFDLHE